MLARSGSSAAALAGAEGPAPRRLTGQDLRLPAAVEVAAFRIAPRR